MNRFVFILEALISALYIKELFLSQGQDIFTALILLLIYLSLKILYYIFKDRKISLPLLLSTVVLITILSPLTFAPISYFLVLTAYQLLSKGSGRTIYLVVFAFLMVFLIDSSYSEIFIIISVFSLLSIYIISTASKREQELFKQNNKLSYDIERANRNAVQARQFDTNAKYQSQLEERNTLAQKLHDELGHTLSGNTIQLEAIKLIMDKDPDKAKSLLTTVIDNLRSGSDSIRNILKNIKPEQSSINISNIHTIVDDTMAKSKIDIELIYSSDVSELGSESWSVITLNIREAMTNLMKYSKAKKCSITFGGFNKFYRVQIKDDGIGCVNIKQGLGISGMEERTSAIGGQLIVDGNQGFSIIMLLPYSN